MFEKTLTDIVKGIRASKRDTALYVSQCIAEIKTEINSSDMFVKANALQKLTFLQMMGYSMNWANFASIEVMSSPRFAHKRIGYLAASQGFSKSTEVVLLTTNLLKKELRGAVGGGMHGVYEAGLAINCISNIVTDDLASDLLSELVHLTAHSQAYLRKKAILCLFKVFVMYPQGLRLTFDKLQHCLNDPSPSVVSCAVNVITELSDKNPKNYLHLAPAFFDLLTKSSNNWMLIKVVKLLGSLVPEEPRLARKLLDPLATIVKNTQAKSLLYESVHTITLCLPFCRKNDGSMPANVPDIVTLCAHILRSFVEDSDQNLKYLGLVGFGSLMQSYPRVLSSPDYRPLILVCLSDQDVTIRTRALELLKGMASQKNLIELVSQLLKHAKDATGIYKLDLVTKIVDMCSSDKYGLLRDFAWYFDVLFFLGRLHGIEPHGDLLRAQVTDVALRVLPVRSYAVCQSINVLLEDDTSSLVDDVDGRCGDNGRGKKIIPEILPAAAWIVGEFSDLIREAIATAEKDVDENRKVKILFNENSLGAYHSLVQGLTAPALMRKLSSSTQKVYIQSAIKVFTALTSDVQCSTSEMNACVTTLVCNLSLFKQSTDPEVVERATTTIALLNLIIDSQESLQLPLSESQRNSDLLGLEKKSTDVENSSTFVVHSASGSLKYLLKPFPMKPIAARVQRKKLLSLDDMSYGSGPHAYLSVLSDFIAEDENSRSLLRAGVETASFTKQQIRNIVAASPKPFGNDDVFTLTSVSPNGSHHVPLSFQKSKNTVASLPMKAQGRQADPFYLDSGPSHAEVVMTNHGDSKFGTIQLLDSDDERLSSDKKSRKKKNKKITGFHANAKSMNLLSYGYLSDPNSTSVYDFNDEEDDKCEENGHGVRGRRRMGLNREFEGLSKVDLTTPLRDDEVMPQRKHRIVSEGQVSIVNRDSKKSKKKKKKQKEKKASASSVGDLLDLKIFDPLDSTVSIADIATSSTDRSNPIHSAFEDLLKSTSSTVHGGNKMNEVFPSDIINSISDVSKQSGRS